MLDMFRGGIPQDFVFKGERYSSMVLGLANISGVLSLVLMPEAAGGILVLEAPFCIASSEWAFCAAPPRPHRPPARQAWPYPRNGEVPGQTADAGPDHLLPEAMVANAARL